MRVHFIAIGGSAMHNLAIALHEKGYQVSGSDDQIFEPSRGRLDKRGLLPKEEGWFPDKITEELDAIILGMHARIDNPELERAQQLGLKVYSYPEYLYEQSKEKNRIVIGGSHGKTTITAMILHVLQACEFPTDYMVGAQLEGFDCMVKLTEENRHIVLEGDEYLSSPIDRRPKFHLYLPHVALLSGIAWDHINVFPSFKEYVDQFEIFCQSITAGGTLIYYDGDPRVAAIAESQKNRLELYPYHEHEAVVRDGRTFLITEMGEMEIAVFGKHNLQNISGAKLICQAMGIPAPAFYQCISTFSGASKRMELVSERSDALVYKDFAHSPSKLKATVTALKEQFPDRTLVACMELHTFSSLSVGFLDEYRGTMSQADIALVYYSPKALAHKKLPPITPSEIKDAFGSTHVQVFSDSDKLVEELMNLRKPLSNFLLMSSGNFGGVNVDDLAGRLMEFEPA